MYFGDFGNDKAISVAKLKEILATVPDGSLLKANGDHLIIFTGMAPETGSGPFGSIDFGKEEFREKYSDHA